MSASTTFGPYSPVKKAGDFYFISGQVGVDPSTKTAQRDVAAQTRQAIHNLQAVAREAGLEPAGIVKTTVFLTNMDDFAAMNEVYESSFDAPRPARSAIAVRELPRVAGDTKLLVEIEAVAYKEES